MNFLDKLNNFLNNQINELKQNDLFYSLPVFSSASSDKMLLNGKEVVMLSSNNYLGFANHPRLKNAGINALNKFGSGTGAVRQIAGTNDLHIELEKTLSNFKQSQDSLVFSSGVAANIGVISSVMQQNDTIISDELNHGSIIDGVRLSKAEKKIFPHKDLGKLKQLLKESQNSEKIMIATDGVFSMNGDIAPLQEICELAEQFNAFVLVDDAHGDGVLGKNGKGTIDFCNVHGKVAVEIGTFSKAFGSLGGFVVGNTALKDFLINKARSFIFTTSLPPAVTAANIEAINLIQEEPVHLNNLWKNTNYFKQKLSELGFDFGESISPIVPIIVGESRKAQELSKQLLKLGVFVKPIVFPLVAIDKARIRCIINAQHSKNDLDLALDALKQAGKDMKLFS
ncbi:MAG: glycine C-acetyltransferase [archaeon]|nr:glycine C-acetyltransferase [archaeon]